MDNRFTQPKVLDPEVSYDTWSVVDQTMKCLMCHKLRKSFHCITCVDNGDFGHTSGIVNKGRFSEKQIKWKTVSKSSIIQKCEVEKMFLPEKKCTALKKNEIAIIRDKIKLLKLAVSEKNMRITDKKSRLAKLKKEIEEKTTKTVQLKKSVEDIDIFAKKESSILNKRINELSAIRPNLKKLIQTRIKELRCNIFTLNEVHDSSAILSNETCNAVTSSSNLTHALTEASQLTYICGKWVETRDTRSKQTEFTGYQIVESILPANGDYSSYTEWIVANKNRDYVFQQQITEPNFAHTIGASLTYTSQFIKQLYFFLNIYLPKHPNYIDFCGNELNETKFSKAVSLLNKNILNLCIKQNVDPKLLHADHTLKNVMLLLDTSVSDLGRIEPPDTDSKFCNTLEDSEDEWELFQLDTANSQTSLQSTSQVVKSDFVTIATSKLASMLQNWTK